MDNSAPIATCTLTGNPRIGCLQLAAPRPQYLLTITRDGNNAHLKATGVFPGEGTLYYVRDTLDSPPTYVGWIRIDGYEWKIIADEKMTALEVFDTPQRRVVEAPQSFAESVAEVFRG